MASPLTSDGRPSLPAPKEAGNDPFVAAHAPTNHRVSDMDHDLFAAGAHSSPAQARRALEARITETDRRLDEAGKLGTALVSKRKALAEQLQSLEKLKAEAYIGPDLRKKLADIEREFNDVARESARVFLPRQRVPSNEVNSGSPYVPEARSGGRRSVSPSKFESQATGSPTKLNVPNRKSRNQPSTRVHDIEFAAEISTSLIAQVRNLQFLLSERDEEIKTLNTERTKLEIESENLQQRLRTLDESEHRYKEENWNLETRLQEFQSLQREAADREKRLAIALSLSTSEKDATQKELEEAKLSHARLTEEHAAVVKHLDIELGTVKRTMATADGERATLQRRVEDLTSQNQELARAFSMQRARGPDRDTAAGHSDDDLEAVNDSLTLEHSPPMSPIKGTPRHSMLETETVKTSLQHAQRTMQSQRNQLHREKTEKLELRRIIQDLRDELEKVKNDAIAPPPPRRSRKMESKDLKKPPRLLGNLRSSRHEILVDDPNWEDTSPRAPSGQTAPATGTRNANSANASDFETANEAAESAFETATETEGFQTGHEGFSGSDTETETESLSRGFDRMRRAPNLPAGVGRQRSRDSFHSTSSTSADEREPAELRTPTTSLSSQRSRKRLHRGSVTRSFRHTSDDPNLRSSPASFTSGGTPQAGQSLFAELRELGGSDEEESATGTPSRRSLRSMTVGSIHRHTSPPPAVPQLPRVIMVDSGVMTDPVKISAELFEESSERPMSVQSVVMAPISSSPSTVRRSSQSPEMAMSRPLSSISQSEFGPQGDLDIGEKLAQFPVPPSAGLLMSPTLPSLNFAPIQCLDVEPRCEAQQQPNFCYTRLSVQQIEPRVEPETPPPVLSLSTIIAEGSEPVSEPEALRPELIISPLFAQSVDLVASLPPSLTFSLLSAETIEPVAEPKLLMQTATLPTPISPTLNMSSIMSQKIEPINEPEIIITSPSLSFFNLLTQELEPREALEEERSLRQPLTLSSIMAEHVQPVPELQPVGPTLTMSSIIAELMHLSSPTSSTLSLSSIATVHTRPVTSPEPETPTLPYIGFSRIKSIESRPISPRSPKRDGFILPRDDSAHNHESSQRETLGLASGRGRKSDFKPVIAEDETRLSLRGDSDEDIAESLHPFREISTNSKSRLPPNQREAMNDQGAQTALTSHAIDKLLKGESRHGHIPHASLSSFGSIDTMGTVRIHRSQESLDSPAGNRSAERPSLSLEQIVPSFRPGSATSAKGPVNHDVPPLPRNHRQLIDAARSGSSRSHPGPMGPPLWPSSTIKQRPFTPNHQRPASSASARATPTPRAGRGGSAYGTAEIYSPTKLTVRSRQSSVSSFASELDSRFNIQSGEMGMDTMGFSPSTDPRMIQAITQTMIGEFLWKYTRKTGRGEMSENRHRRYFWVHPYTRTLYWSNRDPLEAGRSELKAKSVPIEAVRVASDDNPMPPGLHRKSLIVISPGRTVKFTCTTGQRHETWFNALSYLLLRANRDSHSDVKEVAENMTREDVDEFNPQYEGRRTANGNHSGGVPPSLSSYHSRTTRNEAPIDELSMEMPTLEPANHRQSTVPRPPAGTLHKLSVYWKGGGPKLSGTFSSLRGRGRGSNQPADIYEASEVHDSAEDLREIIERQDREADRLENVRACCDGKHNVGTLHYVMNRGRNTPAHGHPGPS